MKMQELQTIIYYYIYFNRLMIIKMRISRKVFQNSKSEDEMKIQIY